MQEEVKFSFDNGELTAYLSGEIDHHSAKIMRESTDVMIFKYKPRILRLDFRSVGFMDSSGIGLIIGRAAVCEELSCRVLLSGLSETWRKLVRLSGVEKMPVIEIE